jgi:hypothetical protein
MKDIHKVMAVLISLSIMLFFRIDVLFTQERQEIEPDQLRPLEDTAIQETYVYNVLFSAPWAKKNLVYDGVESPPGEFGLSQYVIPDSLKLCHGNCVAEGPSAFTIAPNGEIFITDPLNERIQIFNENGQLISVIPHLKGSHWDWSLICVDRDGKVYLLMWHDLVIQYLVKYDLNGKLLTTYPLFDDLRMFVCGSKLYCDQQDNLFFQYYKRPDNAEEDSIARETKIKGPVLSIIFQIGTKDSVFTFEQQKHTLQYVFPENSNLSTYNIQLQQKPIGEFWGPPMWIYDFVDEKGNHYHFWSTKEGITVTKLYKK